MFQQVILLGRVGQDPELRYMQNGSPIAKFTLATTKRWFDNQRAEAMSKTEWHRISVFGKIAENVVHKYVHKGDLIQVIGEIRYSSFEKDGHKQYSTEIIANSVTLMPKGTKKEESAEGESNDENKQQKGQRSNQQQSQRSNKQQNMNQNRDFGGGFEDQGNGYDPYQDMPSDMMDDNSNPSDDIPF